MSLDQLKEFKTAFDLFIRNDPYRVKFKDFKSTLTTLDKNITDEEVKRMVRVKIKLKISFNSVAALF